MGGSKNCLPTLHIIVMKFLKLKSFFKKKKKKKKKKKVDFEVNWYQLHSI